jgi:halocyanin-like protein
MSTEHSIDRRGFVTAAGGVVLTTALAGCSGGGGGGDGDGGGDEDYEYIDDEPDYGGWFSGTSNYEGTVDWTGQSAVTVDVGAGSNGFLFGPPAIAIDAGTTVTWEWTGQGGTHNVVAEDGSFDSGSAEQGSDVTFEHTFEESGTHQYVCEPHESLGMVGAVHVV